MQFIYRTIFSALLLFCVISCASQEVTKSEVSNDLVQLDVKEKILENGLKILVVERHKLPILSYYTTYMVGGVNERPGITGASHFLEHMMFKGAKKYGAGFFDKFIEGSGGNNNAFTTNDITVYFENMPANSIDKIIDVEADRMQNLLLEKESFEKERQVVLEERKLRYENSDQGKLYLSTMMTLFLGTPYEIPVIGSIKDLKSVTRNEVQAYFKNYYVPNNALVIVVGDVRAEDVFIEMEKVYGKIPKGQKIESLKERLNDSELFATKVRLPKRVKLNGQTKNPLFMLAFPSVTATDEDSFALDILSSILAGGESSALNLKMVLNDRPLLNTVYSMNYTLSKSGIFFIGGEVKKGMNLTTLKKRVLKQVRKTCENELNERSLKKVVNNYLIDDLSSLDTNAGIARMLSLREAYYGDYNFYKTTLEKYQQVSVEDVREVCEKFIRPDKALYTTIWKKHPEGLADQRIRE